jgi:UDP-N-acetylmuramoylalanine--D-glutamate ligase
MYLIIGEGKTAASVERYCQRRNIPYERSTYLNDRASRIIVSPGIDPKPDILPYANKHHIPVTNDIGLFAENTRVPCIVITGSNGKSTIVTLLVEMLRAAGCVAHAVGNIGNPVLDYLDEPNVDYFVMEVSSFQLEVLESVRAKVSYISNLSEDHLDRHGTMDAYANEKAKCYLDCEIAVVNTDDAYCRVMPTKEAKRIEVSHADPLDLHLKILGSHNRFNVIACVAIIKALGIDLEKVRKVVEEFRGLPHRCQCVAEMNGVRWYDDSKATNVASTLMALDSFSGKKNIVLILGGRGKGQDFSPLIPMISRYVSYVVLLGEDKLLLADMLRDTVPFSMAYSMQEVVYIAANKAVSEDIVLLSPACSSLDMFDNFEHRGSCFLKAIKEFYHE